VIVGLGIDLCSVARMKRAIQSDHFVERVFHPSEIKYAFSKAAPAVHLAGSFAAREAFCKASSVTMYSAAFGGVWVERTDSAPLLKINDKVSSIIPPHKQGVPHLSITHDGDYAVAVVVIEGNKAHPAYPEIKTAPDVSQIPIFTETQAKKLLPVFSHIMHKGDRGGMMIIGGSPVFRGAPLLSIRGFLKTGGGYGVLFSDESVCLACSSFLPEAITLGGLFESDDRAIAKTLTKWEKKIDCLVLGPGLGRSERAGEICSLVTEVWRKKLIIDGDALFWLARGRGRVDRERTILTPHEGEAALLLNVGAEDIRNDPISSARKIGVQWGPVLLKGARSVIDDGQRTLAVAFPNRTLAVAGSGDVLCGIIAAFAAAGLPVFESGLLGSWIHGKAGAVLGGRRGPDGLLAREIADEIPRVIREIIN
jgi:hydroxyethylthiazole kinase-like uncharacterized protein yjeF